MSDAIATGFGLTIGLVLAVVVIIGAVIVLAAFGGALAAIIAGIEYLVSLPKRMAKERLEREDAIRKGIEYRTRREMEALKLKERDARFWAQIPKENVVIVRERDLN